MLIDELSNLAERWIISNQLVFIGKYVISPFFATLFFSIFGVTYFATFDHVTSFVWNLKDTQFCVSYKFLDFIPISFLSILIFQ